MQFHSKLKSNAFNKIDVDSICYEFKIILCCHY